MAPNFIKSTDTPPNSLNHKGEEMKPKFDKEKVTVILVLGGPGVGASFSLLPPHRQKDVTGLGKGTQCGLLVEKYNFSHLSGGDLLRAEQDRPDTPFGDLIRTHIREGKVMPMELITKLVENAMDAVLVSKSGGEGWEDGEGRFLIDGFPRKMDQALKFEEEVRVNRCVHWSSGGGRGISGVHVVNGALFYNGRGNDVESSAGTW